MGGIAGAIASIYGYKTIGGLLAANSGLIIILIAFICVCLVFRRLLNRQFPSGTREPVKTWVFKAIIIFMICSFIFICAFTVFYEKKKLDAQSSAPFLNSKSFCLVETIRSDKYWLLNPLVKS